MKVTYDKTVNATSIKLKDIKPGEIEKTDSFKIQGFVDFGSINLDFDKNNILLSIEILAAKELLSQQLLDSAVKPLSDTPSSNSQAKISYDKIADAAYIDLADEQNDKVEKTDSFEIKDIIEFGLINLDFNKDGILLGIEVLNASRILPGELLS